MVAKFFHITLAFSVLFSSIGLTIGERICHRNSEHAAFLFNSENCCEGHGDCCSSTVSCNSKYKQKPCCETFGHVVKLTEPQDITDQEFKKFHVPQTAVLVPFGYWGIFEGSFHSKFSTYQPPPLVFDLPVLYQVFLC